MSSSNDVFRQEVREFISAVSDVRGVLPTIADIVRASVDRNFQSGGRFGSSDEFGGGSERWAPSRASLLRRGTPLIKTGQLRRSFSFRVTSRGIEITSNRPYASLHQATRPFIVLQQEDVVDMEDAIFAHYAKALR